MLSLASAKANLGEQLASIFAVSLSNDVALVGLPGKRVHRPKIANPFVVVNTGYYESRIELENTGL